VHAQRLLRSAHLNHAHAPRPPVLVLEHMREQTVSRLQPRTPPRPVWSVVLLCNRELEGKLVWGLERELELVRCVEEHSAL
jgi:hypothetical protein